MINKWMSMIRDKCVGLAAVSAMLAITGCAGLGGSPASNTAQMVSTKSAPAAKSAQVVPGSTSVTSNARQKRLNAINAMNTANLVDTELMLQNQKATKRNFNGATKTNTAANPTQTPKTKLTLHHKKLKVRKYKQGESAN